MSFDTDNSWSCSIDVDNDWERSPQIHDILHRFRPQCKVGTLFHPAHLTAPQPAGRLMYGTTSVSAVSHWSQNTRVIAPRPYPWTLSTIFPPDPLLNVERLHSLSNTRSSFRESVITHMSPPPTTRTSFYCGTICTLSCKKMNSWPSNLCFIVGLLDCAWMKLPWLPVLHLEKPLLEEKVLRRHSSVLRLVVLSMIPAVRDQLWWNTWPTDWSIGLSLGVNSAAWVRFCQA